MSSYFQECPIEIVESIVALLDLEDVRNLRLTGRELSDKASQDSFRSYFARKHVDLTKRCLERFASVTRSGSLACSVQEIALTGVVYNEIGLEAKLREKTARVTEHQDLEEGSTEVQLTDEHLKKVERDLHTLRQHQAEQDGMHKSGEDVRLLSQAFRSLAENGSEAWLRALSLHVTVLHEDAVTRHQDFKGDGWKPIWQAAAYTYRTVMASLAQSGLAINKLDLFNQQQRCSLAWNELWVVQAPQASFAGCRSMSVSVSPRITFDYNRDARTYGDHEEDKYWSHPEFGYDIEGLKALVLDDVNFAGFSQLLSVAPKLEDLELHFYELYHGSLFKDDLGLEKLFQRVAETVKLGRLRKCKLRGVYLSEDSLLAFVRRSPIKDFSMEYTHMVAGSHQSVFDWCTSEAAGMEDLYFDDLFERQLLFFDEAGVKKFS